MSKQFVRFNELKDRGIFNDRMDTARKIANGFPAPIGLGPNTIAWDLNEVESWLASRPRRVPKCRAKKPVLPVVTANAEAV